MIHFPPILRQSLLLLTVIFPLCGLVRLHAQSPVYPVQLHVQLLPPYTPCLADYATGDFSRLRVVALQRDMTQPNYRFALQFTVKQGNSVVLQSDVHQLSGDFLVRPGIATTVSGVHLSGLFNHIHYNRGDNLCLPEGFYELVFQAFDRHNTSIPVSAPASTPVYFMQGQPPFLTFPADDTCIPDNPVLNFTWVDSDAILRPTKNYRLEIYELEDMEVRNYKNIHHSKSPHISADGIKMPFYSIPVTAARFRRGKSYAWRVQVSNADDGIDNSAAYMNGGFSNMFLFRYGHCPADVFPPMPELTVDVPELLRTPVNSYSAYAVWNNEDAYSHYNVEYRRKDDAAPRAWVTLSAPLTGVGDQEPDSLLLEGLSRGVLYEARVQGFVKASGTFSAYSNVKEFVIAEESGAPGCGEPVLPPVSQDVNTEILRVNDEITANGYTITITEITHGGNGKLSGRGQVNDPLLGLLPLQVAFKDILINKELELIDGSITTVYNKATSATLDINNLLNKGATGRTLPEQPSEIVSVDFSRTPLPLPEEYRNTLVQDAVTGKVYLVDEQGQVNFDQPVGLLNAGMEIEQGTYSPSVGTVTFDVSSGMLLDRDAGQFVRYGGVKDYYETLKNPSGVEVYSVPWTFVPSGEQRVITATVEGYKGDPGDIQFVTTDKVLLARSYDSASGQFSIPVVGGVDRTSQGIYAVVRQSEHPVGYHTLGKILLAQYSEKTLDVVIVPVNEATVPTGTTLENLKNELNAIYNPAGINVNVTVDERFQIPEEYDFLADGLQVDASGFWSNETEEMKMLKFLYREHKGSTDKNKAYLFVLASAEGHPGIQGDMPRGKQTGYLFGSSQAGDARLIAHELGHGAFALEHPDRYGVTMLSTDNLMDYAEGAHLTCWQWDLLHNPRPVWSFLDGDESGMAKENAIVSILNSFVLLRQSYLHTLDMTGIAASERTLPKSSKFFEYITTNRLTIKYSQSGRFSNISFEKSKAKGTSNEDIYQIKLGNFGVINCLSEGDRDVIYDFLTNKDKQTKIFGTKSLTLSGKVYTFQKLYSDTEKLRVDMLKSNKTITETDKLILNIPLIQWQLGWDYAAAFYNNWLMKNGDISKDAALTSWLQSWNVYETRISEFETEFNNHINKPLTKTQTKNYYAINSVADLAMTDPQTKIYIMSDLQSFVKDATSITIGDSLKWSENDRKYSNFAITTIAANEDAKTFSAWLASFGSVSIQHCFGGVVTLNNSETTVINVSDMYIYIRDGFNFSGTNQPLGKWENNIFFPKTPNIAPFTWLINEGNYDDLYLTNQKINNFRLKCGIGKDFGIYIEIPIEKLFSKIIINKVTNEIIYQK